MKSARQLVDEALAVVETLSIEQAQALHGRTEVQFVDIREGNELKTEGRIPGAFHAPRGVLEFWFDPSSDWQQAALVRPGVRYVLFCAAGWRSALAARDLTAMGVDGICHVGGGFRAWAAAGAPTEGCPAAPR